MSLAKAAILSLLAVAQNLAWALPQPRSHHAHVLQRQQQVRDEYDYIIVGGGTAGLTVGDRLTEDGKCRDSFCTKDDVSLANI